MTTIKMKYFANFWKVKLRTNYSHALMLTNLFLFLFSCLFPTSHFALSPEGSCCMNTWKTIINKKVLLRERKRHTARRVASARYADLSSDGEGGMPHPVLDRGYPIPSLDRRGTISSPGWEGGYLIQSWAGGYPIQS